MIRYRIPLLTLALAFAVGCAVFSARADARTHHHHHHHRTHHHHAAHKAQTGEVELCFEGENGQPECAMYPAAFAAEVESWPGATPDEEAEIAGIEAKQRREEREEREGIPPVQ